MLPKSDAEKIELQNKVIQLESALYQRQQYIEELLEMVASNDTEVNQAHLSSLHGNTDEYRQSGIPKLEEDLQDIVYDQDVLGNDAIVITTEPNLCVTIANLSSDVDVYFLKNTDHIDSQ
ncbi:uncharacterized protein LOC128232889 isoform X2 [Mya arenaria]|uniref:uncharacterized protein LOC128232889 isoform X2 n=1 Tax=Mya arenaria TaxID=6604 RepID=UPI0022E4AD76|nr:uncharacterized protein LOC128232889 isoform X2 [Mya arenaria]